MIRFVIPAYNERENIAAPDRRPRAAGARARRARDLRRRRLDRRHRRGRSRPTARTCTSPIVRHQVNRGLGTAINSGLRAALGESQDDDAIVTLEADNTSDLDDLPRMLEQFDAGLRRRARLGLRARRADRRRGAVAAGGVQGGLQLLPLRRRPAGDPHAVRRSTASTAPGTLRRAAETYGYLLVREPGFAANVELLLKLYNAGATVAEVADGQRLEPAPGRLEDEPQADRDRLRPPHGRPPRRPHPAAADVAAEQRRGSTPASTAPPAGGRVTAPRRHRRRRRPRHHARPAPRSRRARTSRCSSAAPSLGGLAGAIDFGGHRVDRFYHVIVPSDERMLALVDELGLGEHLSFSPGRRRLLRRRQDVPLQRPGRLRPLPGALAAGARAAGVVRGPVPAAQGPRRARGRAARQLAAPSLRRRRRRPHLAPAARLALRLRPRRAARHVPLGAHEPHALARARRRARARPWAACAAATSA